MLLYRHLPVISMGAAALVGYSTMHRDLFGLDAHREKLSAYKEEQKQFDEKTQRIIDELTDYAMATLDRTPEEMARTTFFWSNQKDTTHFGGFFTKYGTCIGVPVTFALRSRSDIDLLSLKLSGIEITSDENNVNKAALEQLKESLILSDDAKRFALATELETLNSWHFWVKFQCMACVLGYYYTGVFLAPYTTTLNPVAQVAILLVLMFLWQRIYHISEGLFTVTNTLNCDKKATEIGPGYLEGGLEYITKLQLRNQALRRLQKDGDKLYSGTGERITGYFEIPSASLTVRQRRLEEAKQESLRIAELVKETEDVDETVTELEQVPLMQEATDPPTSGEPEKQESNTGYFGWFWRIFG